MPRAQGHAPTASPDNSSSSPWRTRAEVCLAAAGREVVGVAVGDKTPHSLRIAAEATLDAARTLTGDGYGIKAASLVSVAGASAVLVLVSSPRGDLMGAALARGEPLPETAVRATLDALNRRLAGAA